LLRIAGAGLPLNMLGLGTQVTRALRQNETLSLDPAKLVRKRFT
jgi:hypothetical protein